MACDTLRKEAEQAVAQLEVVGTARDAANERVAQAAAEQQAANEALTAANAELTAANDAAAEAQAAVVSASEAANAATDAYFACVVGGTIPGQLPSRFAKFG